MPVWSSPRAYTTTVRSATRDDAHAIARVHVRSRQVCVARVGASSILNGLSVEQRRTIWHQLLANNDGIFRLVAERNATLVGFVSVATPSRDEDATEQTCEVTAI